MLLVRSPAVAALGLLGACVGTPPQASAWPPEDFYLELWAGDNSVEGSSLRQSLRLYRDGLVIYRQSQPPDLRPAPGEPGIEVLQHVCAYRLPPPSLRMLCRLLERDSISEMPAFVGVPGGASGPWLRLRYCGFGHDQTVTARGRIYGPMGRVLHTINAFLPDSAAFTMPEMLASDEPRHVVELPPIGGSLAGALTFHRKLVQRFPDDMRYERELFALACRAGDLTQARRSHARLAADIRARGPQPRLFPELGGNAPVAEAEIAWLDALLARVK